MNEEETYNMYGQKLVDLIEEMEQASVTPQLAACLLLDKAVDLTFFYIPTLTVPLMSRRAGC